jgi:hypothetical protein
MSEKSSATATLTHTTTSSWDRCELKKERKKRSFRNLRGLFETCGPHRFKNNAGEPEFAKSEERAQIKLIKKSAASADHTIPDNANSNLAKPEPSSVNLGHEFK